MTNELTISEKYYLTDLEGDKLLSKGMSIICNYYREKHDLNNMFYVNDYNELCALITKLKSNQNRFGIAYTNTTKNNLASIHKGSIVVDGDKAFILDSLGTGVGSGSKELKEFLIHENLFKKQDIYISEVRIQKDNTSCGTLSFLFLKEALRMDNTFKEFMLSNTDKENNIDNLPPNLFKYMQSISEIEKRHQENNTDYSVYPEMPVRKKDSPKKTENLIDYIQRNKRRSLKNSSKEISIAVSQRAKKHISIINKLLSSEDKLKDVTKKIDRLNIIDDYSKIFFKRTSDIFLFTPTKQKPPQDIIISSANEEKNVCCIGEKIGHYDNIFDFLNSKTPLETTDSTTASNESTPPKKRKIDDSNSSYVWLTCTTPPRTNINSRNSSNESTPTNRKLNF